MKIKLYRTRTGLIKGSLSCYPLGLGYIKSNCKKNHDIQIVMDKQQLNDCDLIGLSGWSEGFNEAIDILNSTKIPVAIGGPITEYEEISKYDFKHVVKGEGEKAFNKIVSGEANEKVICEKPIEDLDTLTFPYRDKNYTFDQVPILTSRGCKYNCSYCGVKKQWKKLRLHSPEYFIEEVKYILKNFPQVERIHIVDNLFASSHKRVSDIYDLLIKNRIHKKTKFLGATIRANIFSSDMAMMLKEMNFDNLFLGAESASNKVLKKYNKNITIEKIEETINICEALGLNIFVSFIIGSPVEELDSTRKTEMFINKIKLKYNVQIHCRPFISLPGAKLYQGESLEDKEYMSQLKRWNIYDEY